MSLFKVTKPSKKIVEITELLGPMYSIKFIEGENCIYRKLNDSYDIEVSGLDNRKKSFSCTIFLWSIRKGKYVENTYEDIKSYEQFLETLEAIEMLYG